MSEESSPVAAQLGQPKAKRTLWIIIGVAVGFLVLGLILGRLITSPAEVAARAEPPEAGLVAVPAEMREISNDIVTRGDAEYEDSVQVSVEVGDLGTPAIVSGQVKEAGETIDSGAVVLEIAGRPVLALPGELPTYRSLVAGSAGPDVVQLKEALAALGHFSGDTSNDVYNGETAAAVRALYQSAGYNPPAVSAEASEAVKAAEQEVRSAQNGLSEAQAAQNDSGSQAQLVQAQGDLRLAEHELWVANNTDGVSRAEKIAAQNAYNTAKAALADAQKANAPDNSMVRSAQEMLTAAQEALSEAQYQAITPMPASELVYLSELPRRIDHVNVKRGDTVSGAFMTVSGAELLITARLASNEVDLIDIDTPVQVFLPDGTEISAPIAAINKGERSGGSGGSEGSGEGENPGSGGSSNSSPSLTISLADLTQEQREELQYMNVRIVIPISSTDGEVLAVPLAALSAGPGGETRVLKLVGQNKDGSDQTELVTIQTGLAAGGFVEVTGGDLKAGDRVVVNKDPDAAAVAAATGDSEGSSEDSPDDTSEPADSEVSAESEEADSGGEDDGS